MAKTLVTSRFVVTVQHVAEKVSSQKLQDMIAARIHTIEGVENATDKPNTDGAGVKIQQLLD